MTSTLSDILFPSSRIQWPSRDGDDLKRLMIAVLLVFIAALLIRFYLTYPVHAGGDAFTKWFRIRTGLNGHGWGDLIDHHQLRWSMNIPTVLAQYFLGSQPAVYYLPSALFGALTAVFAFLIGRLLGNAWIGLVCALLVSLDPRFTQAASQFLPSVYSCAYILGFLYFLLLYCLGPERRPLHLSLAVLFMFLAYGAKIPNLFFLPGAMLFLWWSTRSLRTVVVFMAALAALFAVETVVIGLATGEFHLLGRVSFLSHHTGRDIDYEIADIWGRWTQLTFYWRWLLLGSLAVAILAWFNRDREKWTGILLISASLLSFVFFTTFAIIDLDPLKLAQPLRVRYLTVTLPVVILLVVLGSHLLMRFLPLLPIGFVLWIWYLDYRENELKFRQWQPAVLHINDYQELISDHWRQGYALIFKSRKFAKLYRSVYLTDDILFKEDGTLEPLELVPPSLVNFTDTNKKEIYFIGRTKQPIGYIRANHVLRIRQKVTF